MLVGALFRHWSLRLFAPDLILRQTYEAFKTLLSHDIRSHELMAEFAELYHEDRQEDFARIRDRYRLLAEAVAGMINALEQMHPGQAGSLREYFNKYDFYCRLLLAPPEQLLIPPFVVDHDELVDAALVGQKSHNLLVLKNAAKVPVPDGFTITTTTFFLLIEHNRLRPAFDLLLAGIDPGSAASLEEISQALMALVRRMDVPEHIRMAIYSQYDRLASRQPDPSPRVAVRSSALHEDSGHSFAGQYHSSLGVTRDELLNAYLEVLASKYTPQALSYRIYAGLSDEEAAMAVLVLVMVDAAASGVIYTCDPAVAGNRDKSLLVHSIYGLGLPLVGGETVPDIFSFLHHDASPVQVAAGRQQRRLILRHGQLCEERLSPSDRGSLSISRQQAGQLATIAWEVESFFGGAQDVEWAVDSNHIPYILQSRPLQVESIPQGLEATGSLPDIPSLLAGAKRAAGGAASGLVHHFDQVSSVPPPRDTVLVTRHLPPSLVRYIGRLAAVICEQGAVTGHFATICREFGVVLLVEAADALALLPQDLEVTVDGATGTVYQGRVAGLLARSPKLDRPASSLSGKMQQLLDYITPLHLIDPGAATFRPQSCRSLHDIIRYAHEKAVQTMFGLGDIAPGTTSRCKKLVTDLPVDVYLLDVGGAFASDEGATTVITEQLQALPFLAIWQGLSHPEIDWQSHLHFDWKGFSDIALSGGIASGGAKEFASYAVVSPDYLNLNMRFGYHFTLVDCLCSEDARANYCQVRFAGGGGDYQGRLARIALLKRILGRLGFEVNVRGDLLDARVSGYTSAELCALLTALGRLLGMTKLLDMVVQEADIENYTQQFFQGSGSFKSAADIATHPEG